MMSAIESNVMVNPLNDSNNFKRIDAENRIQQHLSPTTSNSHPEEDANHVSISDTSKQLSALKEYITKAPEVNQARIKFLKEELANGRYRIVSDQIATKMLADIELA
ncbi:flagellar biosynthesis anti-sigma factor FlgM [Legionella micdadei]|uniref:Negative regulator of flagellin synthesis n=1 Tax=Legionella micdadei TaxID=451 RepID=A0A098GGV0_LEGMI|nr:flagellar biosynthesis anti-sigma factor FlgM [Legionella micdadei]ARG97312.1 flagellar biosynthesis anti-sigma factor FlgM [Legionella micdadei]ARH00381.1 flagellar biosynthesis anti-sigma factor FlgM [Legionella micdadei]KTD28192.1 flagellin synthesis negative regulator [Legionella micdadei]NSL16821.1 flagellar biosynthesis anti-sigma factor FlgM [Legionella micdadei]CEG61220.1 conserved protein of unknown function [Legionella micdadei]